MVLNILHLETSQQINVLASFFEAFRGLTKRNTYFVFYVLVVMLLILNVFEAIALLHHRCRDVLRRRVLNHESHDSACGEVSICVRV